MADSSRRAVITGIGVVTPIGLGRAAFWDALREGRGGVRPLTAFDPAGLPVRFAGEVLHFDPRHYIDKKDRKSVKLMARTIQLGVAAAQLALNDGAVDKQQLDPTRFGVEFGASMIATELEELGEAALVCTEGQPGTVDLVKWGERSLENVPPLWMLKYLPNMPACHISILHNAQGPNNSLTENEVSGLLALGEACRSIARDQADFFLVGGAESKLNPLSMVRQCLFEELSHRNDAPEKACRPFDRQRDGEVIGEGAGVLVVEELEHARRRGAKICAEVVGCGSSFDRQRTGAGLARAVRAALTQAGVGPEAIDHINAQGWSCVDRDVWEARGLHEIFGGCQPAVPVFAAKSYLGNLGAGGGTTELAASLLALEHGLVPPTLNYEDPDPNCPVSVLAREPRPVTRRHVLKLSFTPMGQAAAVVCRKWDSYA
jgi:3-oxoacyl-[acyl-carrier-protein] synthase II